MKRLLYFHASWCRPCLFVRREFLVPIEKKHKDKIIYIDAQNESSLAKKYRIEHLPTTIILDGEKEVWRRFGGFDTKEVLKILNDKS